MGLNMQETDRILVVAPHPDDESIGCGGILALYGNQCDVLLLTDGYNANDASIDERIIDIREQEFINAIHLANVKEYSCMRIPERRIKKHIKQIPSLKLERYNYVFVPNRYEEHKDHIATYNVLKKIIKIKRLKAKLVEYEVWTTIRKPNIYLDISDVVDIKRKMIEQHKSQIEQLDYIAMILGLNAYRGRSHGYPYAEAYYCEKEKIEQKIRRIKRKIRKIVKCDRKERC